jgi:GNAT superfamily N-acetyltransferase
VEVRSLGFQTDLMVRRLSGSTVLDRVDHLVVRTPLNPYFYWGNFLLIPPPGRTELERWIGVFEADFPEAGHIALGIDGVDGRLGDVALSPTPGLEADIAQVMTADRISSSGSAPPAAILRELCSDDDWAQVLELRSVLLEEEGAVTPQHRVFLERRIDECRAVSSDGRATFFGALVDDRLRSMLGIFSEGTGTARYQSVETHPDYRRRGLAGHLVIRAAQHAFSQLAAHRLVIVAEPDGPAIGIYRRLGFRSVELQVQLQRAATPSGQKDHRP